ncbi:MAG: hypothetical protein IPL33_22455 [Sphingobacteriales bacterium]|nr:hypothetical protein [Sphingobacteriales bacterium]
MAEGWSTLRFRSICVDPNTLDPDLSNCSSCRKKVEVEYGYHSNIELFAQKMACVLCPEKAAVTIEDWAMLVMQHDNNTQIVRKAALKATKPFAASDTTDATIQTVLTDLPSVINAVSNAISQFSVTNASLLLLPKWFRFQKLYSRKCLRCLCHRTIHFMGRRQ